MGGRGRKIRSSSLVLDSKFWTSLKINKQKTNQPTSQPNYQATAIATPPPPLKKKKEKGKKERKRKGGVEEEGEGEMGETQAKSDS